MKTNHPKISKVWLAACYLPWLLLRSTPAGATGIACQQICPPDGCPQVTCHRVTAPSPSGSCRCSGGADAWNDTTYASWCIVWGSRQPACAPEPTAATGELANAADLAQALRSRNLYVASLVLALQDGPRWMTGTVQGLLHESYNDSVSDAVSHASVLPFTAQVASNGLDTAQIDVTVGGDIARFLHLKQVSDTQTPAAVPPWQVHGIVTSGGLHGSLQVQALDGRSETLSW